MTVLLLRHGTAGRRKKWKGDDRLRPLDRVGQRQSRALPEQLGSYPVHRILSSPYVRCVQTVEPVAAHLGLEVETHEELAEGSGSVDVRGLLLELGGEHAIVCSHGDVIFDLVGWEHEAKKASTWILQPDGGAFVPAVYLPPPT